jgi:carbon-monoxide dehydrogenase medium subunit
VKPSPFRYLAPTTLDECLGLLAEHGEDAAVLAGGQSLLPMLSLRIARPEVLIDVNRLPGLDRIEVADGHVSFGALVRSAVAEHDPAVGAALPVLRRALGYAGHPPIRNRTTIGGSVAHADPASELPAVLAAVDGSVRLASRRGERTLRWDEFLLATFTTARETDELVVGLELPVPRGMTFAFHEVARRHGDYALAGACVGLAVSGGVIEAASIAVFGVAPTPVRVRAAEGLLVGRPADGAWRRELHAAVSETLHPTDDIHASAGYRRDVGATLACRLATTLAERSPA